MSKIEKLLARAGRIPADFTWDEACALLAHYGFEKLGGGKTGGSRRKFFNPATKQIISLHEPHPKAVLCKPALRQLMESLAESDCISGEEDDEGR